MCSTCIQNITKLRVIFTLFFNVRVHTTRYLETCGSQPKIPFSTETKNGLEALATDQTADARWKTVEDWSSDKLRA